jgi:hypothetical protein
MFSLIIVYSKSAMNKFLYSKCYAEFNRTYNSRLYNKYIINPSCAQRAASLESFKLTFFRLYRRMLGHQSNPRRTTWIDFPYFCLQNDFGPKIWCYRNLGVMKKKYQKQIFLFYLIFIQNNYNSITMLKFIYFLTSLSR